MSGSAALQRQEQDPNYVDQATWDRWDRERVERARQDLERNAWQTAGPKGTDHLLERIAELEDALYLKQVALEGMATLLQESISKRERPPLQVAA